MIGDSTVRNGAGDGAGGQWGWGDFVAEALATQKVNFVNRAVGGFSSRTFYTQGNFERTLMLAKAGDIILLQFGHNDAAAINDQSRARGTFNGVGERREKILNQLTGQPETVHTYGWYLRQMIGAAQAKGLRVVLCSPVPRRIWDGRFIQQSDDSYPAWAKIVARQSGIEFLDLHTLVSHEYEKLGKKKVKEFFADKHTHTSEAGAKLTAKIVASNLRAMLN